MKQGIASKISKSPFRLRKKYAENDFWSCGKWKISQKGELKELWEIDSVKYIDTTKLKC